MRSLLGLLIPAVCLLAADTPKPALQQVRNVYMLPMGNSLDQYLATRLTSTGLFQVVADPQKADALFSDKIGEGLETKLDELYPPPEKVKEKSEDEKKDDSMGKPTQRFGSFSKGKGTIFLVDRNSRSVVWSMFAPVKGSTPQDTNKRAKEIVKQLQRDVTGVKP